MTGEVTILGPGSPNLPDVPERSFGPDISGAVDDHDIIRLWLSDQRSEHTVRLYERISNRLMLMLPHGLRGAKVTDLARFEAMLAGQKPNSRHTTMNVVRSLFGFAARTGYIHLSPAHVRKNRQPAHNSRGRCLTEQEVWTLIDHGQTERDRLILRFLYGTAVRISEMLGVTWSDIFVVNNAMRAQVLGKRGIYRAVPVPDWVKLTRPEGALSEDAVFTVSIETDTHPWPPMSETNVRRIIRDAALRAGIRKAVSPHWFRHTALTHIQEKGVSILRARDLAGHTNINTTSKYSHTLDLGVPGDVLGRGKSDT